MADINSELPIMNHSTMGDFTATHQEDVGMNLFQQLAQQMKNVNAEYEHDEGFADEIGDDSMEQSFSPVLESNNDASVPQDVSPELTSKGRSKRRRRCGVCGPCRITKNCDECIYCLRRSTLKQACILRRCVEIPKLNSHKRKSDLSSNRTARSRTDVNITQNGDGIRLENADVDINNDITDVIDDISHARRRLHSRRFPRFSLESRAEYDKRLKRGDNYMDDVVRDKNHDTSGDYVGRTKQNPCYVEDDEERRIEKELEIFNISPRVSYKPKENGSNSVIAANKRQFRFGYRNSVDSGVNTVRNSGVNTSVNTGVDANVNSSSHDSMNNVNTVVNGEIIGLLSARINAGTNDRRNDFDDRQIMNEAYKHGNMFQNMRFINGDLRSIKRVKKKKKKKKHRHKTHNGFHAQSILQKAKRFHYERNGLDLRTLYNLKQSESRNEPNRPKIQQNVLESDLQKDQMNMDQNLLPEAKKTVPRDNFTSPPLSTHSFQSPPPVNISNGSSDARFDNRSPHFMPHDVPPFSERGFPQSHWMPPVHPQFLHRMPRFMTIDQFKFPCMPFHPAIRPDDPNQPRFFPPLPPEMMRERFPNHMPPYRPHFHPRFPARPPPHYSPFSNDAGPFKGHGATKPST